MDPRTLADRRMFGRPATPARSWRPAGRRAGRASPSSAARPAWRLVTPALAGLLFAALGMVALGAAEAQAATGAAATGPSPVAAVGPADRSPLAASGTDWRLAADDADVERHFATARDTGRPVLLYWGASWCPPCNRLKATLFNRAAFVELSRSFVAVHVDGDLPQAQKLGARFRVRGYPTLVLLSPQGTELTRLPGEGDPDQVMRALRHAAAGRPAAQVLADARADRRLTPGEWRMLAFYSWETAAEEGDGLALPAAERAVVLAELAAGATRAARGPAPRPDAETITRLWLLALGAGDASRGVVVDAALRERVGRVLADPAQARRHADLLVFSGDELARRLAPEPGPVRQAWVARFDTALRRLQEDPALARADRLAALGSRVELARLDEPRDAVAPRLPAGLRQEVSQAVGRDDQATRDPYERQAVVTLAAHVLARAGDWTASDALLRANLDRSHSPYYLMSQLGANARRQGRADEALGWFERAYDASRGPATRLQWGASYLQALVDLAPEDVPRIERAATSILADAAGDAGAFHERSGRSLQRVSRVLSRWSSDGRHAEVMARLRAQAGGLCRGQAPGSAARSACEGLLRAPGSAAAEGGLRLARLT